MVFERPKPPRKPKLSSSTDQPKSDIQQPNPSKPKKIITTGSGKSSNSGNNSPPPSPWLDPDHEPNPAPTASFVEYLRWMRSPESEYKYPTKVQLLQMAEEKANYRDRLTQLTQRTKLIAGEQNTFQVKCPWRIRVGGHRLTREYSFTCF